MPYRRVVLHAATGSEVVLVRVPDAAVTEWLRERDRLREHGYPDRPPDIDTPTLRAWLPRRREERLPYFRGRGSLRALTESVFPVLTATWHAP